MTLVCLITPPSCFLLDERVFASLGILRVAAALEHAGCQVEMLDLSGIENYEQAVRDHAAKSEATIFGLTATTPQMPAAGKIANAIRHCKPDARLVLGGPHATLVHAALRRERNLGTEGRAMRAYFSLTEAFNTLVVGDGEDGIFGALSSDAPRLIDADDPKGKFFLTNKRLNELPFPARHLIDMDSYHYTIDGVRATSMIAQLGCPFNCGFCGGRSSPMLRRIRTRTTESVIAEMRHLYQTYGVKGIMCYDDATEILTEERGFVRFADLNSFDKVATLQPRTGELVFETPSRIIRLPFDGQLITVKNRLVDLAVTPDHRMWLRRCNAAFYEHVTAEDMTLINNPVQFCQRATWQGKRFDTFTIPAYEQRFLGRNKGSPKVRDGMRTFPASLWVQFMAWYLSEGSCYRPKVRNGRGYRICIKQHAQANAANVDEIRAILTGLGYRFSYSSNQFHIDSRELYEYLSPFGTSLRKHVPLEFKKMQPELILLFIKTYLKGDGHRAPSGQETITSYSARMRDDLQEMAIKCGYWAATDKRRVLLSQQRDLTVNSKWRSKNHIDKNEYCGDVHCVTVSTGVVLVRRNGRMVWCGNCYDDELNVNKQVVELMNAIADLGKELGIEWRLRGFVKAELFTEEQAQAMYRAGFRWLLVGFESGSPRILTNINKKATREDNTHCLSIARENGLKVKALMSLGHPGEGVSTIDETRDWLLEQKPDDFDLTIITTYPGTPYYDEAIETAPGIWTYTAFTGDRLHAYDVDFNVTAEYYKGIPGEYKAFVFTDYLRADELVWFRDRLENKVRSELGIPFNAGQPGKRYEASMGQLPGFMLRHTNDSRYPALS